MNYHLFQLICRFKLVLSLITLQRVAERKEEKGKRRKRERQIDGRRPRE